MRFVIPFVVAAFTLTSICFAQQQRQERQAQRPGGGTRPAIAGLPASLATLKPYKSMRVSSEDRPGNADFRRVEPGETVTMADLQGPGEITHLWVTISTPNKNHLRDTVLRIYYDGKNFPSVESPIGDFFGLGHSKYYYFNNPVQAIGTNNGMNCFWPMPFRKSARVEITNEGGEPLNAFYFYVDWRKLEDFPRNGAYFHAQYRQEFPNPDKQNYLIMQTSGARGHFVGVSLSIHTMVSGWWGEGDDIITIDGETKPSLWGTGSEDYFCGAWCYGDTFYNDYFGMPLREKNDHSADNFWNVYRLHLESPIAFTKSLKVEIEHGAGGFDNTRAGGRNNKYSSVAYWYMGQPRPLEGKLAAAKERISTFDTPANPPGVYEPNYMKLEGPAHVQDMSAFGADKYLNVDQLFHNSGERQSTQTISFETTAPLQGKAVLRLTKAKDYGKIRVSLDDKVLVEEFNGYGEQVAPETVNAGEMNLDAGKHILKIEVIGKDEKSSNHFWGLDYLRIGGEPPPVEK